MKGMCGMVLVGLVAGIGFWANPALSDSSRAEVHHSVSMQKSAPLKANPYDLGLNPYILAPNPYRVVLYPYDLHMNPYFTKSELDAHHRRLLNGQAKSQGASKHPSPKVYGSNRPKTKVQKTPFEFRKVSELKANPYRTTVSAR